MNYKYDINNYRINRGIDHHVIGGKEYKAVDGAIAIFCTKDGDSDPLTLAEKSVTLFGQPVADTDTTRVWKNTAGDITLTVDKDKTFTVDEAVTPTGLTGYTCKVYKVFAAGDKFTELDTQGLGKKAFVEELAAEAVDAPWEFGSLGEKSAQLVGTNAKAQAEGAVAEGKDTIASGAQSHAEGLGGSITGEGVTYTQASSGIGSHSEGRYTAATADAAHAEGNCTKASAASAHAEGSATIASGFNAHAEGLQTAAEGLASHAEGSYFTEDDGTMHRTTASGEGAHAEGIGTVASGKGSHAEGGCTVDDYGDTYYAYANGAYCHAEGMAQTEGTGNHVEGVYANDGGDEVFPGFVVGANSHAEGGSALVIGVSSHADSGAYNADGVATQCHLNSGGQLDGDATQSLIAAGGYIGSDDTVEASAAISSGEIGAKKAMGSFAAAGGQIGGWNDDQMMPVFVDNIQSSSSLSMGYIYANNVLGSLATTGGKIEYTGYGTQPTDVSTTLCSVETGGKISFDYGEVIHSHAETGGKISCSDSVPSHSHAETGGEVYGGKYVHAETGAIAKGDYSHAEGKGYGHGDGIDPSTADFPAKAKGNYSHAECSAEVDGECSHGEGCATYIADTAWCSHAEGGDNEVNTPLTHVEGTENIEAMWTTSAVRFGANHAEGVGNFVKDCRGSHAEGAENELDGCCNTTVSGKHNIVTNALYSAIEGEANAVIVPDSYYNKETHVQSGGLNSPDSMHVEGWYNTGFGKAIHIEGAQNKCQVSADGATQAMKYSHAEGRHNVISHPYQHVEGYGEGGAAGTFPTWDAFPSYIIDTEEHKNAVIPMHVENSAVLVPHATIEGEESAVTGTAKNAVLGMRNADRYVAGIGNFVGRYQTTIDGVERVIGETIKNADGTDKLNPLTNKPEHYIKPVQEVIEIQNARIKHLEDLIEHLTEIIEP